MNAGKRILPAVVGLAALWLVAGAAPAEPPAANNRVMIKDFMFSPMQLTTKVGVDVTWVNEDDEPHTVVSGSGLFRSAALDTGKEYTFRFDKPGTYLVFCSMHPQMTATIRVE
jgi:plastocyanin